MHAPRAPESVRRQPPASPGRGAAASRPAFTLIELVVVLTIVSILASLTLGGLAVTRQRAKIDKTKSTIRKIHELIVPHYESYVRRRVAMKGSPSYPSLPEERLRRMRALVMFEMPDSWDDVGFGGDGTSVEQNRLFITQPDGTLTPSALIPTDFAWTGVTRGYAAYHHAMMATPGGSGFRRTYPSSECLYMIVSRGLGEPDVMEQFRADEIGDVDKDGAPEFIDGWGRPIAFMRWPVGFVSPIQPTPPTSPGPNDPHDPFDPLRLEVGAFPLTPLIYSAGPDGDGENGYGIERMDAWHIVDMRMIFAAMTSPPPPKPSQPPGQPTIGLPDAADNVTNHDLLTK